MPVPAVSAVILGQVHHTGNPRSFVSRALREDVTGSILNRRRVNVREELRKHPAIPLLTYQRREEEPPPPPFTPPSSAVATAPLGVATAAHPPTASSVTPAPALHPRVLCGVFLSSIVSVLCQRELKCFFCQLSESAPFITDKRVSSRGVNMKERSICTSILCYCA